MKAVFLLCLFKSFYSQLWWKDNIEASLQPSTFHNNSKPMMGCSGYRERAFLSSGAKAKLTENCYQMLQKNMAPEKYWVTHPQSTGAMRMNHSRAGPEHYRHKHGSYLKHLQTATSWIFLIVVYASQLLWALKQRHSSAALRYYKEVVCLYSNMLLRTFSNQIWHSAQLSALQCTLCYTLKRRLEKFTRFNNTKLYLGSLKGKPY